MNANLVSGFFDHRTRKLRKSFCQESVSIPKVVQASSPGGGSAPIMMMCGFSFADEARVGAGDRSCRARTWTT
jgi:hypothetical protein